QIRLVAGPIGDIIGQATIDTSVDIIYRAVTANEYNADYIYDKDSLVLLDGYGQPLEEGELFASGLRSIGNISGTIVSSIFGSYANFLLENKYTVEDL